MSFSRPIYARRPTTVAFVGLWLCAGAVGAREFAVQTLSETNGNARNPSIGETGLVAWQAFVPTAPNANLHMRADVLRPERGIQRSDIVLWRTDQPTNVTGAAAGIVHGERPRVFRDSVVFRALYRYDAGGGYPFRLVIPPKTEEMLKMETEYPDLFDPPKPLYRSIVDGTNPPPADAAPDTGGSMAGPVHTETTQAGILPNWMTNYPEAQLAAGAPGNPTNHLKGQYMTWRGTGEYGDIAVYRPDGTIERITPGGSYVSMPVMSDAGLAFQFARGWPYGYEMIAWKPGTTNLIQLTTNYYYALNADMCENELVFQAWDGDDYEIYLYRFDTGVLEQITNNQFDDVSPVVWRGQIAWVAHPTVTAEIFFMAAGAIRKISEGTEDNSGPSIWEGKVVWQGYDDTDLEIYYFNGRRTIKLTSNTWDDIAPKIHAGVIAWMSYVDNWDGEIMALDLSDNTAVQLTDNDFEDNYPQTAGEKIVWHTVIGDGAFIQLAVPKAPRTAPIN